ncbi:MAG: Rrf2 family transcriptional regulator [Bacteroidetes bacterium]|nr:Rrf2 family transcriptional regulator [Bacteroidota bacterium]
MSASHKLSTAIKALIYLAKVFPEAKNSSSIADEIGVNASKLRLILSQLNRAQIVGSTKGPTGGFYLAQDFTSLSMFEIYDALDEKKLVDFDVVDASSANDEDVKNHNRYFNHFFDKIQNQIEEQMKKTKLENIAKGDETD